MASLVFFIERISFGLYILCAAGILLMAYRLQQARRELAMAQFKLEREQALVRQASAITYGGLLIEVLVGVWAIANVVAPTIRDLRTDPQHAAPPRPTRFVTSTPAPNPPISLGAGSNQAQGPVIFATPVPTATPVGTIIPGAPEIVGCPRENAWLLIPANGQLIFQTTTFWGTATTSDFAFYRFEIKPAAPGAEFAPIGDYTVPVVDGPLGDFYPFNFPTGQYRFRLTVFDSTQTMRHLCEVTINISEPPPTPTPIGAGAVETSPQ